MSQVITKKRKKSHPPPKLDRGQHAVLAARLDKNPATIRKHYTQHKYDKWIENGKYDLDAIKENLPKILNRKYQRNREKQHRKKTTPPNTTDFRSEDISDDEKIKSYLDESIEFLSKLSEDEIAKRNELEKLLMARVKRGQIEKELIDADAVKREAFNAGLQIREGLESIAERCAPLVAASDDQFECREILFKEINHVLNGMADALSVSQ